MPAITGIDEPPGGPAMNLSTCARALLFPFAILFVGCADAEQSPEPPLADDVTGTIVDIHVTDTGDIERKLTWDTAAVAAVVQSYDGQFTRIEGTVDKDGDFVIHDVPLRTYCLEVTRHVRNSSSPSISRLMTSRRSLDLGKIYAGRPDAEELTGDAEIAFQAGGLLPWKDTDDIELFSAGAGVRGWMPAPDSVGDTTVVSSAQLHNSLEDATNLGFPAAIDVSKGDRTFVTQLVTHTTPNADDVYTSVGKVLDPPPQLLMHNGQDALIKGDFSDVPQKTVTVSWEPGSFAQLAADTKPWAEFVEQALALWAEPGGINRVTSSDSPTLLAYGTALADPPSLSFAYGNPFPAEWGEQYAVYATYSPQPSNAYPSVYARIGQTGPVSSLGDKPLAPRLSPPRDIQVNGQRADVSLAGLGLTPTVSWSPPIKGTTETYLVTVREVTTTNTFVGSIRTSQTSVTLPPGMLEDGSRYVVIVRATTQPDSGEPFKTTASYAFADAMTDFLRP